jgi:hypothetical protein
MKARIIDFSIGFNRKQRLTLELDGDFRNTYDELKDCDVSVIIKKHRERRSLDANAYAWILLDKLAQATGAHRSDIYRQAIRNIGGVSETVCVQDGALQRLVEGWEHNGLGWQAETFPSKIEGCTNVTLYYGSSVYDSAQMSRLINFIVGDCKEMGIETLTPQELDRLKEEWRG